MIKKYVMGNQERGSEVIAVLKLLGGKNVNNLEGCSENAVYFIDEGNICVRDKESFAGIIIRHFFDEIKLNLKSNRLYIRGSSTRTALVIRCLEKKGGLNINDLSGENVNSYYYINEDFAIEEAPIDSLEGRLLAEGYGQQLYLPPGDFVEGSEWAAERALQYIAERYLLDCDLKTRHEALVDCERFILDKKE